MSACSEKSRDNIFAIEMLDELHVYDDREPKSAALNMAVDEALLETATAPALRFYRWARPALSFGYFGRFDDLEPSECERDVVRRWTGGGIVLHGEDVTYSIIIPASHSVFARSSAAFYSDVHDALQRALRIRGINAMLLEMARPRISESCFSNAVRADVMLEGRKIAGAAHRRSRAGLLHQGSIQQINLPGQIREDFAQLLCANFKPSSFSSSLQKRADKISCAKYGTSEWLRRR